MKALIFTGGNFLPLDNFEFDKYDLIISADSGYQKAEKMGAMVDVCLGDFDSSQMPTGVKVKKFPAEKDVTDTEIAVDYAVNAGADEILILGGTGGRVDHTIANFYLLSRYADINLKLFDGKNLCFAANKSIQIKKAGFKYISLFPISGDVENLTLKGTKYCLESHTLSAGSSLGVSNEFKENIAEVSFTKGILFIILTNDK